MVTDLSFSLSKLNHSESTNSPYCLSLGPKFPEHSMEEQAVSNHQVTKNVVQFKGMGQSGSSEQILT
jgi:hypothetical protein